MTNDITILSCPICYNPKLREYGNGIYWCDVCETYVDKNGNIVLTEQEWLQTATTEQLAHFFAERFGGSADRYNNIYDTMLEWLKQPHREE